MNRFNAKILGSAILLLGFCAGAFGIGTAKAAQTLPKGGDSFGTAAAIEEGSYTINREIAQGEFEFFKLTLKGGQLLKVKVTTPSGEGPYAGVVVYNADREEVAGEVIIGDAAASATAAWMASHETAGTFYIAVGNEYDTNASGAIYAISVTDRFDADTKADAGGTFDNAATVTIGDHQGYLSPEKAGSDVADIYKVQVPKGMMLTATATPAGEGMLNVAIYDNDREELVSKLATNEGAIVKVSMPNAVASESDVYVKVDATMSLTEELVGYTLNLATAKGSSADDTNGADGEGGGTAAGGKGKNSTLIMLGVGVLVLAGILAYALFKKRGGKQREPAKPSGSGEPSASGPEQPSQPSETSDQEEEPTTE